MASKKTKEETKTCAEFRYIGERLIKPFAARNEHGVRMLDFGEDFSMKSGDTAFFNADMAKLAPDQWAPVLART